MALAVIRPRLPHVDSGRCGSLVAWLSQIFVMKTKILIALAGQEGPSPKALPPKSTP